MIHDKPTILSIENTKTWSWGIIVGELLRHRLSEKYRTVRMTRLQYACQNPRCGSVIMPFIEDDLVAHFDLILPQNHDGVRQIRPDLRERICARIGGIDMTGAIDADRYAEDMNRVGAVIATNQLLYDIAAKHNDHVFLIPNGVDLERFHPLEERPDRPFTIGFAGNIHGQGGPYKGWALFARAAIDLGPEGVAQRYCLHQNAQIPHDKMPSGFYHQIDALVLPSMGEGCSNVVSESLACGVPVILTKVGYHGEMLTDFGNCLFLTPRQVDADRRDIDATSTVEQIKAAVRLLRDDKGLYHQIQQNGLAFARNYHDVKKVAAQYDEVFQGILDRRKVAV